MAGVSREIQELLVDYAGALRDGCIPVFLKSLTREEAGRIASSREFWDAAEVTRVLNSAGFADKVVTPDVGLFISRVNAEIASRVKKARASSRRRRGAGVRHLAETEDRTENPL
ncbi:MAG: hypothetical protein JSU70_19045 [Phycisphaerales bacterium]|nr:MAG: hypothetical protein JSU70_19045 [Phycisphaerales bacterium]